jgi:hypothetical protein
MAQRWLRAALLVVAAALAACGGGGDDGGGGGGGGSSSGSFGVNATSITFSAKRGGVIAPQNLLVNLTGTGIASVAAGYRPGVTQPAWLNVTAQGTAPNLVFVLGINATGLASGSYSTTLTIGTADINGGILATRDIAVTLTLRDGIVVSSGAIAVSAISGHSDAMRSGSFTVTAPAGVQWTASGGASWITLPAGPQGAGTYTLAMNTAGLPAGRHDATITLTNTADPADTAALAVSATLAAPAWTGLANALTLGGAEGYDTTSLPITFALGTGTNAYPWTIATSSSGWLQASVTSGAVSAAGTTVQISADRAAVAAPGTFTGSLVLRATINGQVIEQMTNVTLNHARNRLVASAVGVALSSFPGRQVLTRSLNIVDSYDAGAAWQASSSQAWLAVTASGVSGAQPLVLTANPAGLVAGQYFALVTVNATDPAINTPEVIRVGLTVRGTDPVAGAIDVSGNTPVTLAVNPVEPEVVITRGGLAEVYDVYSGVLLRSLPGFNDVQSIVFSADGTTLYAFNAPPGASPAQIRVLDPGTGNQRDAFTASGNSGQGRSLAYARPDGVPMVLSPGTNDAFVALAGTRWPLTVQGPAMDIRADQRVVYTQNSGFSPSTIEAYRMRYSGVSGNPGLKVSSIAVNNGIDAGGVRSNGADVALSADGTKLFIAAGAPYRFDVLNPTTLAYSSSLAGDPYPTNVETCWNGRLAAGIDSSSALPGDLYLYSAAGTLVTNLDSGAQSTLARNLRFSADCTRLISATPTGLRIQGAP